MTYYGRWTYKYEIAAQKGAAAAVIVHETEPAGYPYEVVTASWGRENFEIQSAGSTIWLECRLKRGFMSIAARELFEAAGSDFDAPQAGGYPQGLQAGVTSGESDIHG